MSWPDDSSKVNSHMPQRIRLVSDGLMFAGSLIFAIGVVGLFSIAEHPMVKPRQIMPVAIAINRNAWSFIDGASLKKKKMMSRNQHILSNRERHPFSRRLVKGCHPDFPFYSGAPTTNLPQLEDLETDTCNISVVIHNRYIGSPWAGNSL